ncbi:superoxide dismutase family protein [Pedobacter sp. LMG 31464]|uniref:Superoxide dismutase [Cu-Zn] n=1 Tax=Pedobacter planticolens TaxID=2679964 RepID=A0A923E077_9SPHI|nr:superoxide dismutase family protein [Pedobacter planticolens]MBB2146018.1 superoxide dismutase family protein [Pedobacter planticolens]
MKKYLMLAGLCLGIALSSCTSTVKEVAQAILNTTSTNKPIGVAKFYSLPDGKMKMDLEINFPERADSTVAVHFHEHGDCGNMGENAHGHWNPTNEVHGKWGSAAYHSGDIGNIKLDNKGHGTISISTDRWSIIANDAKNIIGRGIIVHGGTDDYTTQPTGNSGPRVGCGVIEAVK